MDSRSDAFPLPLVLEAGELLGGVRQWMLKQPYRYATFEVPAGFVTDLASVPRIFWNLFPPSGSYLGAAVVHDHLYCTKSVSRSEADGIFLEAMKAAGVSFVSRWIVYSAVRAGGWMAWKD